MYRQKTRRQRSGKALQQQTQKPRKQQRALLSLLVHTRSTAATRQILTQPQPQVSGTIGGRNQGTGVYGVLPGVRVLPVKVLGDSGSGSMSDIMAAIKYVTTNAVSLNVRVINLSLGAGGSGSDPICASIQAAVDRGIVVVIAAGNSNQDLLTFSPAACSAAVAVTAIDAKTNTPADFSNWLGGRGSADDQRRTVAAPGVNILSVLNTGAYEAWSGTSMATPHVAGIAARCFAAGDCKLEDGTKNRDKLLTSVWEEYNADAPYRWNSGSSPVYGGKFYGPLVWAQNW